MAVNNCIYSKLWTNLDHSLIRRSFSTICEAVDARPPRFSAVRYPPHKPVLRTYLSEVFLPRNFALIEKMPRLLDALRQLPRHTESVIRARVDQEGVIFNTES